VFQSIIGFKINWNPFCRYLNIRENYVSIPNRV